MAWAGNQQYFWTGWVSDPNRIGPMCFYTTLHYRFTKLIIKRAHLIKPFSLWHIHYLPGNLHFFFFFQKNAIGMCKALSSEISVEFSVNTASIWFRAHFAFIWDKREGCKVAEMREEQPILLQTQSTYLI